jgi:hypothetical protein
MIKYDRNVYTVKLLYVEAEETKVCLYAMTSH